MKQFSKRYPKRIKQSDRDKRFFNFVNRPNKSAVGFTDRDKYDFCFPKQKRLSRNDYKDYLEIVIDCAARSYFSYRIADKYINLFEKLPHDINDWKDLIGSYLERIIFYPVLFNSRVNRINKVLEWLPKELEQHQNTALRRLNMANISADSIPNLQEHREDFITLIKNRIEELIKEKNLV